MYINSTAPNVSLIARKNYGSPFTWEPPSPGFFKVNPDAGILNGGDFGGESFDMKI